MSLDIKKYSEAMDNFLMKMEKIPDNVHPDTQAAFDEIAKLLRIALVKVILTEPSQRHRPPTIKEAVLYHFGEPDESRSFEQTEGTADGCSVHYVLLQKNGEPDWSDDERSKLAVLTKMLYVFNGRIRVMQIAEQLTFHDRELGIYNLSYFMKFAGNMIESNRINRYAACYFNLKSFSYINKLLGRNKATEVMFSFLKQLEAKLSVDEIIVRIGGDNFAALFYKEHLDIIIEYLKGVGIEYDEKTHEKVRVSAVAGYYIIPEEGVSQPSEIMDRVSVAINIARNVTKESSAFYNEEMAHNMSEGRAIEDLFPVAIKNEEFQVYYQPKVSLKNYSLAGAEALCRWFHEGKMIMPFKFIPVLEQTRAITALDFYMLEHVCMDIRRWLDEGRPVVKVSVNLSRRHLGDMDLLNHILSIIDKYDVPHKYIEIELTETTTDVDFRDLKDIVTGLQKQGINTSVDDFGIGYSSLNLIRELPWNVLKIDKSFIDDDSKGNSNGKVMLKHVISMAQEIGLECIVEGVESAEQIKLLKENNCFMAQGYYFDKPLPKQDFEQRLNEIK